MTPTPWTLHYSPGACSLSCHVGLEESGLAYARHRVLRLVDGRILEGAAFP